MALSPKTARLNTEKCKNELCSSRTELNRMFVCIRRRSLRMGRAAGPDGIPPELLKCAIGPVSTALHTIFKKVWRTGHIPADWKDGILTALYKGKGSKTECGNYRPITLLSIPGKVFAHVLLARIQLLLDITRRPEQFSTQLKFIEKGSQMAKRIQYIKTNQMIKVNGIYKKK